MYSLYKVKFSSFTLYLTLFTLIYHPPLLPFLLVTTKLLPVSMNLFALFVPNFHFSLSTIHCLALISSTIVLWHYEFLFSLGLFRETQRSEQYSEVKKLKGTEVLASSDSDALETVPSHLLEFLTVAERMCSWDFLALDILLYTTVSFKQIVVFCFSFQEPDCFPLPLLLSKAITSCTHHSTTW